MYVLIFYGRNVATRILLIRTDEIHYFGHKVIWQFPSGTIFRELYLTLSLSLLQARQYKNVCLNILWQKGSYIANTHQWSLLSSIESDMKISLGNKLPWIVFNVIINLPQTRQNKSVCFNIPMRGWWLNNRSNAL